MTLAKPRGFFVRALPSGIFEVQDKRTGRSVCRGTAAEVHKWLRTKPISEREG